MTTHNSHDATTVSQNSVKNIVIKTCAKKLCRNLQICINKIMFNSMTKQINAYI